MRTMQDVDRLPDVSDVVAILTAPPAAGLFPIGDCEEQEFRELLCTTPGGPPGEERPELVSAPPEALLEHLAALVLGMRARRQLARELHAEPYGLLHSTLAFACMQVAKQRPLPFLGRAITLYEHLLGVFTREDFPEQWAEVQFNLGLAYHKLPIGNRQQNLERAIACYQQALLVRTREAFPADWANTQDNLSNAYNDLPGGELRAIEVWHGVITYFQDIMPVSVEPRHLAAQAASLFRRVVPPLLKLGRTADVVGVLQQGRAGRARQTSASLLTPARVSARKTGSRAACLRLRAMLSFCGCCLSRLSATDSSPRKVTH